MSSARLAMLVAVGFSIAGARPAAAHPLDMGYLRVGAGATGADDAIDISLDLDVAVVAQLLHVEPSTVDDGMLAARDAELAHTTYAAQPIRVGEATCTWERPAATMHGRNVVMTATAHCPRGAASWELPFVARMSATFRVLARVRAGSGKQAIERSLVIDKSSPRLTIGAPPARSFGAQVRRGIAHGIPPAGLDYLVLVLALVLGGVGRSSSSLRIAGLAGATVAAHAAGVGLAFAGVPSIGALALVVPVAIIVVALVAVPDRRGRAVRPDRPVRPVRAAAVIAAGLAGGLAIADGLDRTASGLAGFELGLGLAMMASLLAIGPLVAFLLRDAAAGARRRAVAIGGLAIAVVGAGCLVRDIVGL